MRRSRVTSHERKALLFLGVVALLGLGVRVVRSSAATPAATVETRRALLRQIAAVDSARSVKAEKKGKGRASGSSKRRGRGDSSDAAAAASPVSGARQPVLLPGTSVYGELLAAGTSPRAPGPASHAPRPTSQASRHTDVDRATVEELERLPGVGPLLAHRIAEERARNGPFGGLEALDERVKGVGPALAKRLAPHVTFSGPRRPTSAAAGVLSPPGRAPRGHRSPRPPSRAP